MKWTSAMMLGALITFLLPLALGGQGGVWLESWAGVGTVRPFKQSPGLLFSIPMFLICSIGLRLFFNWHAR